MSRYYRAKTLMLKGEKGDTGYSITDIQMNDDYTLTITLENGMHFHTQSIRGEKGERGTGIRSVELRDDYSLLITLEDGKTLETTAILGKEFENIRTLEASATSASKIATSASTSASASAQSASQASISASESASNASKSASASAQSAKNASQSATNAQESASSASTSADTATSKATEASASATKAKESETNAKSSETNASNSAEEAKASAVNAKASETKAEEYANNLQNSTEAINQLKVDLVANTKEDAKTKRSLSALWALNNGISYRFETDSEKAYKRQIPSGAKLGAVNTIGGRTIVYNQHANIENVETAWGLGIDVKSIKSLSNHKLYIMNKFEVKEILDSNRDTYVSKIILFGDTGISTCLKTMSISDIAVGKNFIVKGIVQAPNNFNEINDYTIGDDTSGLSVKCNTWKNIIDLTQMYGSGNEPSTVEEFEEMFPLDYYPYNEGTLMSMSVNEVKEQGKNYFDFSKLVSDGVAVIDYKKQTITIPSKANNVGYNQTLRNLCPRITQGKYMLSMKNSNAEAIKTIYFLETEKDFVSNEPIELTNADLDSHVAFYNNIDSNNENVISEIQIEKNSTNTSYSPYHENSYTIPQALQNLEGYGWSAGNAYNYVDFENKKFYKYVGRYVVTGDEDLHINEDIKDIYIGTNSTNFYIIKNVGQKDTMETITISNRLMYLYTCWMKDSNYNAVCFNSGKQIHVRILNSELGITKEATIAEARNAMNKYLKGLYDSGNPVIIYYELAKPIVTDISDIIGDTFQEPFNVENGGSLTFKNTNGDGYQIAVPNDVQYVVSLKEVTS